jgi:hypothetical protein
MLQIQGVEGEAVVIYREPSTTKEMRYHRFSQRVNNVAIFLQLLDITLGLAFYAMLFMQHWG